MKKIIILILTFVLVLPIIYAVHCQPGSDDICDTPDCTYGDIDCSCEYQGGVLCDAATEICKGHGISFNGDPYNKYCCRGECIEAEQDCGNVSVKINYGPLTNENVEKIVIKRYGDDYSQYTQHNEDEWIKLSDDSTGEFLLNFAYVAPSVRLQGINIEKYDTHSNKILFMLYGSIGRYPPWEGKTIDATIQLTNAKIMSFTNVYDASANCENPLTGTYNFNSQDDEVFYDQEGNEVRWYSACSSENDAFFLDLQCIPCGNGILNPSTEECDGTNFGAKTCQTEGFDNGNLVCTETCTLDTTYCYSCGDGTLESTGEECDDGNLVNGDGCSSICQIESSPSNCGNGIIENGEKCEPGPPANFGRLNCSIFDGFTGGHLICNSDCTTNTSQCTGGNGPGPCGNGIVNTGEECDKNLTTGVEDWGHITGCLDFDNFNYGQLFCNYSTCQFISDYCYINTNLPYCGDGEINQTIEQCDKLDMGSSTCPQDLPFGEVSCNPYCQLDISNCYGYNCTITSLEINLDDCSDVTYDGKKIQECKGGDEIEITATIKSSILNPNACANYILQIDAQDEEETCLLRAAKGDIDGINTKCSKNSCSGEWEIPDDIAQNSKCADKIVNGAYAKLISKENFNQVENTYPLDPELTFKFPEPEDPDSNRICYSTGGFGPDAASKAFKYCDPIGDGTYYECVNNQYVKRNLCAMECGASPQCWLGKVPGEVPCDMQCQFQNINCWESWSCSDWGTCVYNKQTRTCSYVGPSPQICDNPKSTESACEVEVPFPIYTPLNFLLTALILVSFYFVYRKKLI